MVKFLDPPILVGGRAMAHYALRKSGPDWDYVISIRDYNRMAKQIPPNENMPKYTPAISVGEHDYFLHLYGYDYRWLVKHAKRVGKTLVISKEDLLLVKSMTAHDRRPNQQARKKNLRDVELIVASLISEM